MHHNTSGNFVWGEREREIEKVQTKHTPRIVSCEIVGGKMGPSGGGGGPGGGTSVPGEKGTALEFVEFVARTWMGTNACTD